MNQPQVIQETMVMNPTLFTLPKHQVYEKEVPAPSLSHLMPQKDDPPPRVPGQNKMPRFYNKN